LKQNRRDNDLRRARLLVEEGEHKVAQQLELIADLKRKNRSTQKADALLVQLQHSLLQMRNYLSILEKLKQPSTFEF